MITHRQIAFREEYRSRILGWYDGYFHIVIIYAMGAAAFYIYVQHIHGMTAWEWLTIPLTFLFTNIFEWAVHKFVMHRPVNIKGLRSIYERIGEAAEARGLHAIQSLSALVGRNEASLRVSYYDWHPNRAGHALLAQALADGIDALPAECGVTSR